MADWQDPEELVEQAQVHFEAGRYERAAEALRSAIKLNPTQATWHFNLGLTLDASGHPDEAAPVFERAHELSPSDPQSAMMAGACHLRSSRFEAAIHWLEKAQAIDAGLIESYVHRIDAYAQLDDLDQAEVMFYLAQQIDPHDAPSYAAMGVAMKDAGQWDRAIWCLREAAKLDPELPGVFHELAEAYEHAGRPERARQLFIKELRLDPGNIETLLALAQLLIGIGRHDEASEKLRRILELQAGHPEARLALATLAAREGRTNAAIAELKLLDRQEIPGLPIRRRLVECLLARGACGDKASAIILLDREAEAYATDPDAWSDADLHDLARLALDLPRPVAADLWRDLAARTKGRSEHLEALHLWSVALFQAERRDEGRAIARRVLAARPGFAPALHNLALSCLQDGLWRRARYWARLARQADPDDVALRRLRLLMLSYAVPRARAWVARRWTRWFARVAE
jgi:tetratricopeptide (TPR) repeat protein